MVEKIYEIKNELLGRVSSDLRERGVDRIDVKEMGELIDMVKDLAEAEKDCWKADYYRKVSEAMEQDKQGYGSQGYGQQGYGSQGSSRMGYGAGTGSSATVQPSRQGYSMGGYHEAIEPLREALRNANPDEREKIRKELRSM